MKDITPEMLEEMTDKEETEEYKAFKEKFKPKKTTDDCYTPENIYEAVASWVSEEYGIDRSCFVRPFWPGGDYEHFDYPEDCVVVDNPPFSILAKIYDFFYSHGIKFFLFAPSLTIINPAFKHMHEICIITAAVSITYDNGATVHTSFTTNLDTSYMVTTAPVLYRIVDDINKANQRKLTQNLPKYSYPDNVFTAAMGNKYSKYGVDYRIKHGDAMPIRSMDAQQETKKAIYGGGLLLSEKAAVEKAAAEKAAAEKAGAIIWELSEREKNIIKELSGD